jgi:hypothetical protein
VRKYMQKKAVAAMAAFVTIGTTGALLALTSGTGSPSAGCADSLSSETTANSSNLPSPVLGPSVYGIDVGKPGAYAKNEAGYGVEAVFCIGAPGSVS